MQTLKELLAGESGCAHPFGITLMIDGDYRERICPVCEKTAIEILDEMEAG